MADIPFLFVGNHPCLDFINTALVLDGEPRDLLATPSDVAAWAVQAKVLTQAEADGLERSLGKQGRVGMLDEVRTFRAVLRDMIERIAANKPVPETAVQAINNALRTRVGYPQVTSRKGTFERRYQMQSTTAPLMLGLLAESAADLLTTCDLSLIKKCQNPACILFFYDTTKNHARHWCSMRLCGNRHKVAAHYRRSRKSRG